MKRSASRIFTTTQRDICLLIMAYLYLGCSIPQRRKAFFRSTQGGRAKCYERVARLVELGLLLSTRTPSLTGVGSGKAFLTIAPKAKLLVAQALGIQVSELEPLPS